MQQQFVSQTKDKWEIHRTGIACNMVAINRRKDKFFKESNKAAIWAGLLLS